MAVAVSLGSTGFDFTPLIREQQRLSKQLLEPRPGSRVDPTQPLVMRLGTQSFNAYIKVLEPNSTQVGAQPTYQLFYRDNNNVENQISSVSAGNTLGDATNTGTVSFDLDSGEIRVGTSPLPSAPYQVSGTIQFQAASGLTLAAVNRRLADINSAIEAMSRVMQVANGATEQVQQLLR
ncbi:MAG: hypothetical protein H7338_23855 [Candidatus Sericytochromatia bacterium]|nr:hypothetical protein [Candidatus Sericytochromatia bacterium]